ncbi:uncharacterized protein RAG0_12290 [Rhynchosporium agropyri]|uniref:Uncharacterized protein n=1 Tax=Rhynchosporium agropyri TaxID=914238 RepID=A0A1E1L7T4_9HELO|nr:uncharacterized protein RAG0_12290 [Rhynchosporium agropyri]
MFDGQKEGNKSLKPLDFSLLSGARTRSLMFFKRPLGFSEENASVLELQSFLDVKRISSKVLRGGHLLTAPYVETTPQPSRPTETTDGRAQLTPFPEIRGQQSHVQEKGLENQPVTGR